MLAQFKKSNGVTFKLLSFTIPDKSLEDAEAIWHKL